MLLLSSAIFIGSIYWIYAIISSGTITRISTALLSSSITLFCVLFTISLFASDTQMIISDSVLVLLYLAYNVWIMSRSSLRASPLTKNQVPVFAKWKPGSFSAANSGFLAMKDVFYELLSIVATPFLSLYSSTISIPINSIVDQSLKSWSVEIILNFLLRVSLFILVPKLVESNGNEEEEEERIGETLNSIGKACLVLVYTHSGGFTYDNNVVSFFPNVPQVLSAICESQYWRWANVYFVLALYLIAILNSRRELG